MRYILYVITTIAMFSSGCKEPPNIIFIMSDDHATQALSCYGSRLIETPNLDQLAADGMLFNKAFVTNSICAPSRAVILTGKHSHLNGVPNNHARFDSSQVTFPKILQKNGYRTAMIGKWHLKSQPTGFDYWNVLPGQGDYYNPRFFNNGSDTTYHGYVTDIICDLSLEWLSNRRKSEPFLLMVHNKAPHRNWMPGFKHLNVYDDVKFPQPASFFDDYSGREHLHQQKLTVSRHMDMLYDLKIPCDTCPEVAVNRWTRNEYWKQMNAMDSLQVAAWDKGYEQEINKYENASFTPEKKVDWKYQRYLQDYLRCILSVDENVGRILEYLDQHGLSENTIIVYTSDQGFFLGEHGLFDKRYMYEESLRTPLIIKHPGETKPGQVSNVLVQNLDIAPTLLEVAGADIPDDMQGRSLRPLFESPASGEWREAIYYQFFESGWGVPQHYGVRTKSHKLIHFLTEPDTWELYNLEDDPHEMVNLYLEPGNEAVIKDLKSKIKELRNYYQVPD